MKKPIKLLYALPGMVMLLVLQACGNQQPRQERPNILLIVSEDHGQHLSCYGDKVIRTPGLDQIAADGFLFKNAYISESVCSPSRSTILSGLYPHQTGHLGLTTHGFHFAVPVNTIYNRLKQAGYRTGMIGKLHVDPGSEFPMDFHAIKGGNFERKAMGDYAALAGKFMNDGDQPFFLMVNFPDAHWPFKDQVDGQPEKLFSPNQVKPFEYLLYNNDTIQSYTTSIYNCLARLDWCVGNLMDQLKQSGKANNTIVIYLSDHGDEMARGKFDVYEAGTKVPFLVSWPGNIKTGVVSNELVSTIDIVPTMLEVAGLPADKTLPGKSLLSLFRQPDQSFREYLFTEKNADQANLYYPRRAVRDKKYKLIYSLLDNPDNIVAQAYMKDNRSKAVAGSPTIRELEHASEQVRKVYQDWLRPNKVQLYDLENDPWEFNDLSKDPQYDSIKNRLLDTIISWQETTNDPLRFPEKLALFTQEVDTMKISKNMVWRYPEYLYGNGNE